MGKKLFRLFVIYHILVLCIDCAHCLLQSKTRCPRPKKHFPHVNLTLEAGQNIYHIVSSNNTFSIPHLHSGARSRELVFDCNASYPIEWVFISPTNKDRQVHVKTTRYIPVPSEPWNNVYSARLKISVAPNNKVLKETNQTCRSVQDKACLQTTVTTKKTGPVNNQTWAITIAPNNPSGIVLLDYDSPQGINPNCSISLTYDPTENQFCCVNRIGTSVPVTQNIGCTDPTNCRQLYSENKCAKNLIVVSECPAENSFSLPPTIENDFQAGVVVCHDENEPEEISDAVHYFYSLPKICAEDSSDLPTLYFSWFNVKLFEFLSMCQRAEPIYVGEKINFTCVASLYYTSGGIQFAIKRHNKHGNHFDIDTEEHLDYIGQHEFVDEEHGFRNISREILFNDTNIKSIICYAPQRNSIDWLNKEVHLNILDPTEITFEQGEDLVKYEDNLKLRCQAHGKPKPILTWLRKGNELSKRGNLTIVTNVEFAWTEIWFLQIEDPTNLLGNYTCRAKNQLGHNDKVFYVLKKSSNTDEEILTESTKSTHYYVKNVVVPVIAIVVLFIFIFLVLKIVQQTRKLRKLTHAEIEEFMHGRPDVVKSCRESNYEINSYANCLPYNKKYEILKDQLEIDENAILGTGAYGMVLKGTLTTRTKTKIKVAIKTVKPMDDITYFKALLSELKIMAFIGKHCNIINLIGAYTSNIEKREIYIATEFCDNGNVLSFLKRNRRLFTNMVQNGEITADTSFSRVSYGSTSSAITLSTINLLKWGSQISDGMDFLGKKKVIHGDLAARNVFITEDLIVKIGDFGLSKQLFEYANYIKKKQSPLPWKWLAIECLQDMQFSVKSDVWAFGITLWEIFSLGQTPYMGSFYNEEFVNRLIAGVRLTIPQYATNKIYDEMLKCWDPITTERPTFSHFKMFFDSQLDVLVPKEYMELEEREISPTTQVTIENSP